MTPTKACLYCETELVPSSRWKHWAFCPKCNPEWIAAETPPDPGAIIRARIGGLMEDKGVSYRDGKPYDRR